jgi:hypothetical protein
LALILQPSEACRFAGHAANQIRNGHQQEDAEELNRLVPATLLAQANEVIE